MSEHSEDEDKLASCIEFEPRKSDHASKILPTLHRQVVTDGLVVGMSHHYVRQGEYFDLSHAEVLLKPLGVYDILRDQEVALHAPDVSGRSFERAVRYGDGIHPNHLEEVCEHLVDALSDGHDHVFGLTREFMLEGLRIYAKAHWVPMPLQAILEDGFAATRFIALSLITLYREDKLEPILKDTLSQNPIPDEWFEGQALGWLIRQCRVHRKWSQEELQDKLCMLKPKLKRAHISVRTLRRWENSKALPRTPHPLQRLAQVFYPDDEEMRRQLHAWFKIAYIVDWFFQGKENDPPAEQFKRLPSPHKVIRTPEYEETIKQDARRARYQKFVRTVVCLAYMTDEEFALSHTQMMCGAQRIPSDILKNLTLRYTPCPFGRVTCTQDLCTSLS